MYFDFEFNVQEHSNLNFMKDMLLHHKKLQLEYQKEQVWSETLMFCFGFGFFLCFQVHERRAFSACLSQGLGYEMKWPYVFYRIHSTHPWRALLFFLMSRFFFLKKKKYFSMLLIWPPVTSCVSFQATDAFRRKQVDLLCRQMGRKQLDSWGVTESGSTQQCSEWIGQALPHEC